MKKNKILSIGFIALLLLSTACNKKLLFTQPIKQAAGERIEKMQFYNDRQITIVCPDFSGDTCNVLLNKKFIIPKSTTAIAKLNEDRLIDVFFDKECTRNLFFGEAIKDNDYYYQLYSPYTNKNNQFYVNFDEKKCLVTEGADAKLQVLFKEEKEK